MLRQRWPPLFQIHTCALTAFLCPYYQSVGACRVSFIPSGRHVSIGCLFETRAVGQIRGDTDANYTSPNCLSSLLADHCPVSPSSPHAQLALRCMRVRECVARLAAGPCSCSFAIRSQAGGYLCMHTAVSGQSNDEAT